MLTVVYVLSLVLMAIVTNVKPFLDKSDNVTEIKNTTDNSEMQFNTSTLVTLMVTNVEPFLVKSENVTESKNATDNSKMQFNTSTSVNWMVANQIAIMTIGIC